MQNTLENEIVDLIKLNETRSQIKQIENLVRSGTRVFWVHEGYEVLKYNEEFNIVFNKGQTDASCIGLSNTNKTSLNGRANGFFTIDNDGKENFLFDDTYYFNK